MAVAPLATYVSEARKFVVGVIGLVGQIVALNVLHGSAEHAANVVLAALTAVAVYLVPNAAPGTVAGLVEGQGDLP
jgi:pheromone shutdown protein TraB